jgi:hypothetical protein
MNVIMLGKDGGVGRIDEMRFLRFNQVDQTMGDCSTHLNCSIKQKVDPATRVPLPSKSGE